MTKDQVKCLKYLTDKMEAPGESIGRAVRPWIGRTPRGYTIIGNRLARQLWLAETPLVSFVSDLNAWRITAAGRAALQSLPQDKATP